MTGPTSGRPHEVVKLSADCSLLARKVDGGLDLWEVDVPGCTQGAPQRVAAGAFQFTEPRSSSGAVIGILRFGQLVGQSRPLFAAGTRSPMGYAT